MSGKAIAILSLVILAVVMELAVLVDAAPYAVFMNGVRPYMMDVEGRILESVVRKCASCIMYSYGASVETVSV